MLCGVNSFEHFKNRIIDDEYIAYYDCINLVSVELSSEKLYYPMFTSYAPLLEDFVDGYSKNRRETKMPRNYSDERVTQLNTLRVCVLPNIRFIQVPSKEDALAKRGCLNVTVGQYEVGWQGKVTIPIAVSFSHALLDGYDFFQIVHYLTKEYAKGR